MTDSAQSLTPDELMARAEARVAEPATDCYCDEIKPYTCLVCRKRSESDGT